MHCEDGRNYSRNTAYPDMGFNNVCLGTSFKYFDKNGNRKQLDADNYHDLIDRYEGSNKQPQFIYLLTFQNHGGYEQNESSLDTVHTTKDYNELTDDIDEYLSSVYLSAKAFKELTEYFEKCNRPVVVLMVGDHAPSFIKNLLVEDTALDEQISKRSVPYVIWANYKLDYDLNYKQASLVDLLPILFKTARLPLSSWYQCIIDLHDSIPVRTSNGLYMDNDYNIGVFNQDAEYYQLINNYYCIEYNSFLSDSEYMEQIFMP